VIEREKKKRERKRERENVELEFYDLSALYIGYSSHYFHTCIVYTEERKEKHKSFTERHMEFHHSHPGI